MPYPKALVLVSAVLGTALGIESQGDTGTEDVAVVVDGRDDEPLAGVTVVWSTPPNLEPAGAASRHPFLWSLGPETHAEWEDAVLANPLGRAITDSAGRATVDLAEDVCAVVAYSETHWGRASVGRGGDDENRTIRVYPDVDLRVSTLDPTGAPASGVPVALRRTWSTSSEDRLQAVSDADGIATLRHAGYVIERELANARRYMDTPAPRWSVALDLCTGEPFLQALRPTELPTTPVTLFLPPTCEVEVRVVDAEGDPVETQSDVALCPAGLLTDGRSAWARYLHAYFPPGVANRPAPGGVARFPYVIPGQELVAVARRNCAPASVSVSVPGPTVAGTKIAIEVPLGPEGPTITGRIVRADGTPVASTSFVAEVHEIFPTAPTPDERRWVPYPWPPQRGRVHADADGRFSFELEAGSIPPGGALVLEQCRNRVDTSGAALDIRGMNRGAHDVGDVVIGLAPLLVSGYARDETGAPVRDAVVSVSVPKGSSRFFGRTDEDGAFAIRTHVPHPEVNLNASKPGHGDCYAHDLATGSEGVQLELARAGRVRFEMSLPEGLRRGVSVGVSMKDWDGRWGSVAPNRGGGRPDDEGRLRIEDLHPGKYRVRVRVPDGYVVERKPLVVRIVAGEETVARPIRVVARDG